MGWTSEVVFGVVNDRGHRKEDKMTGEKKNSSSIITIQGIDIGIPDATVRPTARQMQTRARGVESLLQVQIAKQKLLRVISTVPVTRRDEVNKFGKTQFYLSH